MSSKIHKAVIPAAGLGTRFLPVTKNSPKEMLPLVDKPAIQYVVEEAVNSGLEDIIIITGRGKQAIENHFDMAFELEHVLRENNEKGKLRRIKDISELADIHYVRQKKPLGLGDAVLCAKKHVGNEPFALLLGDDIVFSEKPCTLQLMRQYEKYGGSIIAVERVPADHIEMYGVIDPGERVENGVYSVTDLIEKPSKEEAPSDLGILGRYILTPEIFRCIEKTEPGYGGEIQLTDALKHLSQEQDIFASEFQGKRFDLGNKADWLKTNFEVALMKEEFRKEVLPFMKRKIREIEEET